MLSSPAWGSDPPPWGVGTPRGIILYVAKWDLRVIHAKNPDRIVDLINLKLKNRHLIVDVINLCPNVNINRCPRVNLKVFDMPSLRYGRVVQVRLIH